MFSSIKQTLLPKLKGNAFKLKGLGLTSLALIAILAFNKEWNNHGISSSGGITYTEMSTSNKNKFDEMLKLAKINNNNKVSSEINESFRWGTVGTILNFDSGDYIQVLKQNLLFSSGGAIVINKSADTDNDGRINDEELGRVLDRIIESFKK